MLYAFPLKIKNACIKSKKFEFKYSYDSNKMDNSLSSFISINLFISMYNKNKLGKGAVLIKNKSGKIKQKYL